MAHWAKGLKWPVIRNELALRAQRPYRVGDHRFIGPPDAEPHNYPKPPVVWPNADVIAWNRMQTEGQERLARERSRLT